MPSLSADVAFAATPLQLPCCVSLWGCDTQRRSREIISPLQMLQDGWITVAAIRRWSERPKTQIKKIFITFLWFSSSFRGFASSIDWSCQKAFCHIPHVAYVRSEAKRQRERDAGWDQIHQIQQGRSCDFVLRRLVRITDEQSNQTDASTQSEEKKYCAGVGNAAYAVARRAVMSHVFQL